MAGVSALGVAGLSTTAAAATRPEYGGLDRGVSFKPNVGSGEVGEATRVDTNASTGLVQAFGAIKYPDTAPTEIEFVGFDSTPGSVDVALFEVSRGTVTGTSPQVVNFVSRFKYSSLSDIDDFFVDLVGDTLIS